MEEKNQHENMKRQSGLMWQRQKKISPVDNDTKGPYWPHPGRTSANVVPALDRGAPRTTVPRCPRRLWERTDVTAFRLFKNKSSK